MIMRTQLVLTVAVVFAALGGVATAGDVKSGLALGDFPDAFEVKDVTGPEKGTSLCYRCRYGSRPTVSIFTRNIDANLAHLVKQIDAQVGKNGEKGMKAFVIVLTDNPKAAEQKLNDIAKKNGIMHVPLTIFENSTGPKGYKISKKADVSIMMWVKNDVKVNHSFGRGELDKKNIQAIVENTRKILN